jgi:dCMP deaminase
VPRPGNEQVFLEILDVVKKRSTCPRRQVAAILTTEQGHILATGYNGAPRGFVHCTEEPCAGASDPKGDTSRCEAVHAEQNAIVQAGLHGKLAEATRLYCTTMPCTACAKLIVATNVKLIVVKEEYADSFGAEILKRAGISLHLARYRGSSVHPLMPATLVDIVKL